MIITFIENGEKPNLTKVPNANSYIRFTRYFDDEFVIKRINSRNRVVKRQPAPEVLCGTSLSLRQSIAATNFKFTYTSGVMTFDKSDIDVAAFNSGSLLERSQIDRAIVFLREVLWPNIPIQNRPTMYITTHTHVGRMEVNFATPRFILCSKKTIKSYNPNPPTPKNYPSKLWMGAQEVLNQRFGWTDPCDPRRTQALKLPNWILKNEREGVRNGVAIDTDIRVKLFLQLEQKVLERKVHDRRDVIDFLSSAVKPFGWIVLSCSMHGITVGPEGAAAKGRVALVGELFDEDFHSEDYFSSLNPFLLSSRRSRELAAADQRFLSAWNARSRYNLDRFGHSQWSKSDLELDTLLNTNLGIQGLRIPARHHLHMALMNQKGKKIVKSQSSRAPSVGSNFPHGGNHQNEQGANGGNSASAHRTKQTFSFSGNSIRRTAAHRADTNISYAGIRQFTQVLLGLGGTLTLLAERVRSIGLFSGKIGNFFVSATVQRALSKDFLKRLNRSSQSFQGTKNDRTKQPESGKADECISSRAGSPVDESARHSAERWRGEIGQLGGAYKLSGADHFGLEHVDRSGAPNAVGVEVAKRGAGSSEDFPIPAFETLARDGEQKERRLEDPRIITEGSRRGLVTLSLGLMLGACIKTIIFVKATGEDGTLSRRNDGFLLAFSFGEILVTAHKISVEPHQPSDDEALGKVFSYLVKRLPNYEQQIRGNDSTSFFEDERPSWP